MTEYRPIVVCGPSGVGKSTNITRLMKEFPGQYGFSVSHTTRMPRPGETDGVQYHFVTVEKFKDEVAQGGFVEWAVYSGNYYGTSVKAIQDLKHKKQIALLDIDIQGGIAKERINPFYIMLTPPSIDELQKRLTSRGDTSPNSIRKRLETAAVELEYLKVPAFFDRVVYSRDFEGTYQEFKEAIIASQIGTTKM